MNILYVFIAIAALPLLFLPLYVAEWLLERIRK